MQMIGVMIHAILTTVCFEHLVCTLRKTPSLFDSIPWMQFMAAQTYRGDIFRCFSWKYGGMGIWADLNSQDTNLEICSTSALWNHVLPSESSLVFESRAKVRNLTKSWKYSENVKVWNSEDRISAAGHFHIWQRWSPWRTLHFSQFLLN